MDFQTFLNWRDIGTPGNTDISSGVMLHEEIQQLYLRSRLAKIVRAKITLNEKAMEYAFQHSQAI